MIRSGTDWVNIFSYSRTKLLELGVAQSTWIASFLTLYIQPCMVMDKNKTRNRFGNFDENSVPKLVFLSKIEVFFGLVDFFRPSSGLGGIYNLHFRTFRTFSFRAKKKLEIKKMFFNISPNIKKKCPQYCTRNLDLVRKMRKWTFT